MVRLAGLWKSPTLRLTVCGARVGGKGARQHPSSFPSSGQKAAHCVVNSSRRTIQSSHGYTRTTKASSSSSSSSSVAENWSEVAWDFFPRQDKLMVAACLGINVLSVISYVLVAPCLGRVIDVISNSSSYGALAKAVGALTLAYIVSNSTLAAQVRLASCVGERVASRVRSKLFGTMMWTDHSEEADSGTMMSWLSNDVQVLQTTITKLLGARGIRSGLETIGIICVLMWLNWVLALMLLISAPVLTPLVLSAAAKINSLSENVQASTAQTSSAASEIIENQKIIRVNQAEDAQIDRFRGLVDEQSRVNTQLIVYQSLLDVSGRLRNVFCVLLTVGLGAHLALMNQVSIGTCYSFFIYGFGFAFALSNVAQSIGEVFKVVGTMKQVMSHFMSDISSSRKQTSSYNNLIRSGLDGITVEFRNVSFTHNSSSSSEEGDSWSMENLNFTMPAHTTTALVGPSGGGKSTIASLLLGFYKPTSGEIYVDGVPLSEIDPSWWKEQIGMVEQKPGLLVGKVSDVVSYGNEDATREDIVKVLEQTQALNFVNNLPQGLDSLVGGDGIGISGGQAQRLALARALLRKPRLLILDEATSALDVNTESAINIFDASQDDCPTTLVIAHRLNTVRDADNIIVVAHGKIVETGTHDELVSNTDGIYARLVQGNSTFLDEEHANEENPAAVVVF